MGGEWEQKKSRRQLNASLITTKKWRPLSAGYTSIHIFSPLKVTWLNEGDCFKVENKVIPLPTTPKGVEMVNGRQCDSF